LLNIFGGTAINAARAIAYQIRSVIMQFISNILTAVNPQIFKLYSRNNKKEFYNMIFFSSKASFFLMFLLAHPVFFFTNTILTVWLDVVPPSTVIFVQLIAVFLTVRVFHNPLDSLFKATGEIKRYQIIESSVLFLNLPISYVLLKFGFQ